MADVLKAQTRALQALSPGQDVFQGDGVALGVDLDRPAYVYVMYIDARGEISELFPRAGDVLVPPHGWRLPSYTTRWQMNADQGPERFIVIAARAPLATASRAARAAMWKPSGRGDHRRPPLPDPAVAKVPVPPAFARPRTSDAMCSDAGRSPTEVVDGVVASPDADGVTTAVFTVHHR